MYQLKLLVGPGVNYIVIGKKVMATEKKDRPWDGKSRPVNDKYRDNYDSIFGKLQQEQRDLDESYRQSLKNKKERSDEK